MSKGEAISQLLGGYMKKLLLFVVLLAAAIYAFTSYFTVNSQRLTDGTYRVEMVNKVNGKIYVLLGD